ncbi:MAG: hypothetical protein AB9Q19_12555 [Candidatus Reddybacter sp.]
MAITASTIITDRLQAGGDRKIREQHIDHMGNMHHRQFIVAADYDEQAGLVAGANSITASLVDREVAEYIAAIESSTNPFRDSAGNPVAPAHLGRNTMLSKILRHFLSLDSPVGLAPAVPYLANLSDEALIVLLGIDQNTVNIIRQGALDVTAIQSSIDGYSPVLGGDQ